jgi:hypothetical protein
MPAAGSIIGGVLSAGGGVAGGMLGSQGAESAAAAQTEAARGQIFFDMVVRNENIAAINDAVDRGIISIQEGNRLAQETLRPLATQPLGGFDAMGRFQKTLDRGPGDLSAAEQRQFGRGVQALQAGFSTVSGGGGSSRAFENAIMFGQDFEAKRLDQALNRLLPLVNLEAGLRSQATQNIANIQATGGLQEAQTRLGGASALAGIPTQGISQTIGQMGQIGAAGAINQANVQREMIGNILQGVNTAAQGFMKQSPTLFSGAGSSGSFVSGGGGGVGQSTAFMKPVQ